jgi:hypothetical protein
MREARRYDNTCANDREAEQRDERQACIARAS